MPPEIIERISQLREQGVSCSMISAEVGYSIGAINYHCLREGIESPFLERVVLKQTRVGPDEYRRGKHIVKKFTPEEDDKITAWSIEGIGPTEIGRRINRRHHSIIGRLQTLARHDARRDAVDEFSHSSDSEVSND